MLELCNSNHVEWKPKKLGYYLHIGTFRSGTYHKSAITCRPMTAQMVRNFCGQSNSQCITVVSNTIHQVRLLEFLKTSYFSGKKSVLH